MGLLLQILFSVVASQAQQTGTIITVHGALGVWEEPVAGPGAQALFYAVEGEKLKIEGPVKNGFRKVSLVPDDGMTEGYVRDKDLRRSERLGPPLGRWGFGGGMEYNYLKQQREPFSTADDVSYRPSAYLSKHMDPFIAIQRRRDNFWRIVFGRKTVNFKGTAKNDIAGSKAQDVTLDLSFWSAAFQKAWNPWRRRPVYFGFDFEVAKATSQKLTLDRVVLPTEANGLPYYVGIQALAGVNVFLHKRVSLYIEAKGGAIVSQSPAIFELSGAAGAMYWP